MKKLLLVSFCFSGWLFSQDPMLDPNMLFEKEMIEAAETPLIEKETKDTIETKEAAPEQSDNREDSNINQDSGLYKELQEKTLRYEARILRLEKELTRLTDRISQLEQRQKHSNAEPKQLFSPKQDVVISRYSEALELFTQKKFVEAQRLFTEIVRQNDSDLVWYNAMYWNAECSFHLNKLNEALILLSDVLDHPDQAMREKSLLLMAVALEKLNRIPEAQQYYQQFIRSYPFSNYAPVVRKKLGMS